MFVPQLSPQVTNVSLTINISCTCSGGKDSSEVAKGVAKGVATLLESKLAAGKTS